MEKSNDDFDPSYTDLIPPNAHLKHKRVNGDDVFILIIWTLLFGLVACFLGFALFKSGKNYWQFNVNGLETKATVVSCEIVRQGIRSYRPQISYVYTVEGAVYNANYDAYSAVSCEPFRTDAWIDIKYYKHNPSQSRVVLPHTENSSLWVIVGTSGVVCGFLLTLAAAILGTVVSIYHIATKFRDPYSAVKR